MQSFCRASELCGMTSSDQTQKPVQLLNGKVCIIQTVLTLVQEHTVYLFLPNWSIFCKAEMWVLGDFSLISVQLGWFSQRCSSLACRCTLRIVLSVLAIEAEHSHC